MPERPKPHVIAKMRKSLRACWPLLETYMHQFVNEERLGNGRLRGRPFHEKAWTGNSFQIRKSIAMNTGGIGIFEVSLQLNILAPRPFIVGED